MLSFDGCSKIRYAESVESGFTFGELSSGVWKSLSYAQKLHSTS
jgi:hypothetical protein